MTYLACAICFLIGLLIGLNTEVSWGPDRPACKDPCEWDKHDWKMCTNHVRCAKCGKIEF